jgi:hypothetical protein
VRLGVAGRSHGRVGRGGPREGKGAAAACLHRRRSVTDMAVLRGALVATVHRDAHGADRQVSEGEGSWGFAGPAGLQLECLPHHMHTDTGYPRGRPESHAGR